MRRVEGWGRHLRGGSRTAVQATLRAHPPHRTYERSPRGQTGNRLNRHGLRHGAGMASARLVHDPSRKSAKRIPASPARERDDGETLAAAGGDATRPAGAGPSPAAETPPRCRNSARMTEM